MACGCQIFLKEILIFLFFCQYFGLINISYMIDSVWVYAQTHRNIQHKHPNNGVLTKQIRFSSNDERNISGKNQL